MSVFTFAKVKLSWALNIALLAYFVDQSATYYPDYLQNVYS